MNKNIEIKKIKVNNGQELIQKAKEYKNSGGEWKLLERYYTGPADDNKKEYEWGIVIANGQQEIDIKSANNNWVKGQKLNNDDSDGSKFLTNALDMDEVWDELCQIFPEIAPARQIGSKGYSLKKIEREGKKYLLGRYLVAENSWHLRQILNQYVRENESKIYQSVNPHFSGWVEIIDGQDGNMYLYVGEKNDGGGREIKIGITKEEYEKNKRDENDTPSEALKDYWGLFTLGRPQTPAETKKYYSNAGGLEENWQTVNKFWEKTCRWTLEQLRNDLAKGQEFWDNEPSEETRTKEIRAINQKITQINNRLEDMKKNQPEWYNNYDKFCPDCGNRMCCHHWGNCGKSKKNAPLHNLEGESDNKSSVSPKSNNKNNQISDNEKSQLLNYFLKYNVNKISFIDGKLIIEYKNNTTKTAEGEDQQLQKYHQLIKTLPSQSLSLSDLQENNTNNTSTPDKNNTVTYLVLAIGAFILGGIFVYFLARKKKK